MFNTHCEDEIEGGPSIGGDTGEDSATLLIDAAGLEPQELDEVEDDGATPLVHAAGLKPQEVDEVAESERARGRVVTTSHSSCIHRCSSAQSTHFSHFSSVCAERELGAAVCPEHKFVAQEF